MSLTREQMLVEMGITPLWVLREVAADEQFEGPAVAASTPMPDALPQKLAASQQHREAVQNTAPSVSAEIASLGWDGLVTGVQACRACDLCKQRKQAVLGVGDHSPDWLFIGEGPGAEEDARGEPFVGQAGKLLDNMLASLDVARGQGVYIANAVKCRPPGNRTPEAAEMAACRPWLLRQIELLKPRVIVLLGKAAVHSILHEDKPLAGMRGKRHQFAGIPVVVTYHPAYLLRNLPEKAKAWEDLVFARKILREAGR